MNPTTSHKEADGIRQHDSSEQGVAEHVDMAAARDSVDSAARNAIGGDDIEDLPKRYYWSYKFIGSSIAFAFSYHAQLLGYVFAANVLSIVDADIGPSPQKIWVLLAYILCQCVTFTIVGRISDLFGRRYFYLFGSALALIASIASAKAENMNTLIGMSALNGIASAIQVQSSITAGELLPNKWRFVGFARTWVSKTSAGWRWCYYFLGMLAGIAFLLELFCYFPPKFQQLHHNHSFKAAIKSIDYIGLLVFSGSLASVLLGVSWGGTVYEWASYEVIVTIVVGGVGLICFFLWETFARLEFPLVPVYLLKNRNYDVLMACSTLGSMIFYALSVIWPQQIEVLFNASADDIGWISCTINGGAIAGALVGTITVKLIGHIKWQLVVACIVFTTFTGAMAAVTPSTKTMAILFSLISSMGIGYMEIITLVGGPLSVAAKDIGLASGLQFAVRTAFDSLADSIYVTILANKVAENMPKYIIPAVTAAGLSESSAEQLVEAIAAGNATLVQQVPGITPAAIEVGEHAAQIAYRESFKIIYLASLAFGGLAVVASLVMSAKDMQATMTTKISRRLQGLEVVPDNEKAN
ncbi:fungal trichothecene efflux pump [Aspergillus unguis]